MEWEGGKQEKHDAERNGSRGCGVTVNGGRGGYERKSANGKVCIGGKECECVADGGVDVGGGGGGEKDDDGTVDGQGRERKAARHLT